MTTDHSNNILTVIGIDAGAVLRLDADEIFHRLTDDVVKKELALKQNPMEVGADKIARTAP